MIVLPQPSCHNRLKSLNSFSVSLLAYLRHRHENSTRDVSVEYHCAADPARTHRYTRPRGGSAAMRALIVGGGISGLAAAVALQRVGITAAVFERAPQITEVGAGLSLWSNAMVALRRLGLDAAALEAGSVIERTRTFLCSGESSIDFAALAEKAGAPSICLHRATLQRLLLDAALCDDPRSVQTGRECTGFEADAATVTALFSDGA